MALPATAIKAQQVTWNSLTWNTSSGGPVRVRWRWVFRELPSGTGADVYPTQVFGVEAVLEVRVTLREGPLPAPMTKSNMVVTYKTKDGTRTRTFANLKFFGIEASQDRDNLGEDELVFYHESADGTTDPVT